MNTVKIAACAALVLSLGACDVFRDTVVSTPPARCASLVPDSWSEGVEAVPVPDIRSTDLLEQVKGWAGAYTAMSGQLAKANGRTADTIGIVQRCEEMINASRPDHQ